MSFYNNHYLSSINIDLISNDANISITDTHKIFVLPEILIPPPHTHFIIGVQSFSMPYTFYSFRDGINNTFTITTIDNSDNTLSIDFTIPAGNYSINELMSNLNTQFTTQRLNLGLSSFSINLNQSQNTLYLNLLPQMQSLIISSIKCYKELGFTDNSSYSYSNCTTCTFPKIYNLSGDNVLYLRLKNKVKNINSRKVYGIMACIDNAYMPNEIIYYKPNEIQYFKINSKNIDSLEIQILDENMNDIGTLNTSASWRITLTIHYSYDKDIILEDFQASPTDVARRALP